MTDWLQHSRWHELRIDAGAFADFLDTTYGALAQGTPCFPEPADRRFGPRWTEYQVFTTILGHYPALADRVPRWFPDPATALAPAQFLGAESVSLGGGADTLRDQFAAHYWQPADERGVLAIAYPRNYVHATNPETLADDLLKTLAVSAVIVPCGQSTTLPNGQLGE